MSLRINQQNQRWTRARVSGSSPWCVVLLHWVLLAPHVGRETIRILLQNHELKPWREKSWSVADLNEEYITRMEDVLSLYEKPSSEKEPVVCVDEKPVVLHADVRHPRPMRPGRIARRDSESTNARARPTSSVEYSPRRKSISPKQLQTVPRRSSPITSWRS